MPYRQKAQDALAEWREADRRLASMRPADPEWPELVEAREAARARYQAAVIVAQAKQLPEPPPFDEATRSPDAQPS